MWCAHSAFAVHSMPLANYLLEAHGGARGRSTGFTERTKPVQVSRRTASAVLAAQCQQTVADEHGGQRNTVQLVFDVWHKPARTFKDQVL